MQLYSINVVAWIAAYAVSVVYMFVLYVMRYRMFFGAALDAGISGQVMIRIFQCIAMAVIWPVVAILQHIFQVSSKPFGMDEVRLIGVTDGEKIEIKHLVANAVLVPIQGTGQYEFIAKEDGSPIRGHYEINTDGRGYQPRPAMLGEALVSPPIKP